MRNNLLENLPIFCSNFSLSRVCQLESLDFGGNKVSVVLKKTFLILNHLKYLNLAQNQIETIEEFSFDPLLNLETLSLASNKLSSNRLFGNLVSIKVLNLSSNLIEILREKLFFNLNKLITIDLSSNRIYSIRAYSFSYLFKLKHLYLNNNSNELTFESNTSFYKLESLTNIYVTKEILNNMKENNKCFFRHFAKSKNLNSLRNVSKRKYFNSINLLAYNNEKDIQLDYDCNMTLSFIQYNIHFNLKSDLDLFYYVSGECEKRYLSKTEFNQLRICTKYDDDDSNKDETVEIEEEVRILKILSNGSFYFVILLILSLLVPVFGMVFSHLFNDYTSKDEALVDKTFSRKHRKKMINVYSK